MNNYLVYSPTGKIISSFQTPEDLESLGIKRNEIGRLLKTDNEVDINSHYVANGEVVELKDPEILIDKLDCLANNEDEIILSNIPIHLNTKIYIDNDVFPISAELLTLVFTKRGEHLIKIKSDTFKTYEVTINAN